MRELATLGFFDPEGLDVNPIPNPQNGTVDIEYKVVEKPSDQIEASGGWGGFGGFVGTLGLTLNNFSTRKMFKKVDGTLSLLVTDRNLLYVHRVTVLSFKDITSHSQSLG